MVAQIEHAVPYVTNRFDGLRARRNSYFKGFIISYLYALIML